MKIDLSLLNELAYKEILRKQRSIDRLFPTFYDRVKKVGQAGGVSLDSQQGDTWVFRVASATHEGLAYANHIRWVDLKNKIPVWMEDDRIWKRDKSGVDLTKLASTILTKADLEVHCDCLVGSTKVPLLDGRVLTLEEIDKEMGRKEFWLIASDAKGDPVPARAKSLGVIREVDSLVETTLDNGKKVRSTKDHLFRLRDGSYRRADKLSPGDSLMPYYSEERKKGSKYSQSYIWAKLNSRTDSKGRPIWKSLHRLVAEKMYPGGKQEAEKRTGERISVVHHKDMNSLNNTPGNLEWLGKREHWDLHSRGSHENSTRAIKEACSDPVFMREMRLRNSRAGKMARDKRPDIVAKWNQAGVTYAKSDRGRREASNRLKELWRRARERMLVGCKRKASAETKKKLSRAWSPERKKKASESMALLNKSLARTASGHNNHKVVAVEIVKPDKPAPVYDLTVFEYQNFALDAGIFVHNCPAFLYWGSNYILTQRDAIYHDPEDRPPKVRNPKKYGAMCKHLQLLFDTLPFFGQRMASHLKNAYSKVIIATQKEIKARYSLDGPDEEPEVSATQAPSDEENMEDFSEY